MDDVNILSLRWVVELVARVGVACYVLFRLWSRNDIMSISFLILISGIIEYGERIWVLIRSNKYTNQTLQPGAKQPCILFDKLFTASEAHAKRARKKRSNIQVRAWSSDNQERERELEREAYLLLLQEAYLLFPTIEILSNNFDLIDRDQRTTYDLVSEKKPEEAFQLIEVELGFKYDQLYSKVTTISWLRIILHSISYLSSISALVCFSIMTKSNSVHWKNDTITSYMLLIGTVWLQGYASIMHFLSDWGVIWLCSSHKAVAILNRIHCLSLLLSFCRKRKRWSKSMGQHTLISFQSCLPSSTSFFPGNQNICSVGKLLKELIFKQVLDKRLRVKPVQVGEHLKEFIFKIILDKSSNYDPETSDFENLKTLLEERGDEALRSNKPNDQYVYKFGWSVAEVGFIHSILTWHIATHFCVYVDSKKKIIAKDPPGQNCVMSRSLSNYMLYLLVDCPTMLATEPSEKRCADTSIHLHRLLSWHSMKEKMGISRLWATGVHPSSSFLDKKYINWRFLEDDVKAFFDKIQKDPKTMIREIHEQDEGEMSALLDGCMLALSLQSLETKDGWSNDKKWKMVSEVWVEMLMYAASNCGWKEHTRALSRGGELLTHVCLLMAHLGLSRQCPPTKSEQLAARYTRLDDILESESSSI